MRRVMRLRPWYRYNTPLSWLYYPTASCYSRLRLNNIFKTFMYPTQQRPITGGYVLIDLEKPPRAFLHSIADCLVHFTFFINRARICISKKAFNNFFWWVLQLRPGILSGGKLQNIFSTRFSVRFFHYFPVHFFDFVDFLKTFSTVFVEKIQQKKT